MYGHSPLYPPCPHHGGSLRMPLFDSCVHDCACRDCQTVRICNPVCREEYVDVELCVDGGGNLSICVHRPPRPCPPPRPRRKKSCCDWVNCGR